MGSLPYNIRVNVNVPFPALVAGAQGIKITKSNGIWTIAPDYTAFPVSTVISQINLPNSYFLVWNSVTGFYTLVPLTSITQAASPTPINVALSPYVVQSTDSILYVDSSGGAVTVTLPAAVNRNGFPLTIKDVAGAAATHNISIVPNGTETIDGLNPLPVNANYGGFRLYPKTGGWVIAP